MFKVDKLSSTAIDNLVSDDNPSFSGIVAGVCKGDIWVDDIDNPNIALVYSSAVGGFSILGEPSDEKGYRKFKSFIIDNMLCNLNSKDISCFEFSIESEEAKPHILDLFNDKIIQTEVEYTFRCNEKYKGNIIVPDDYKIFKVDYNFLRSLKSGVWENHQSLVEQLLESWEDYKVFLKKSVGYVAVNDNRIVAVIIGTSRFKNIITIDIETEDKHRNKGLAIALTQHFLNECINNGLIAQWDCMDSNIASKLTAERAGFHFFRKDIVYWFKI